jgi:mRNA-degrading endonuclease RelE of RelBE toxin-antitoxin system
LQIIDLAMTLKRQNLKGEFLGLKKYRIGDYRVIFCMSNTATILMTRS